MNVTLPAAPHGQDWMRAHAELAVPGGGVFWEHGASDFIYKVGS